MASIFTKIINGEIPCYKIAEDEKYFAFLDINPMSEGHTLVIPKVEIDYIFDLEDDLMTGLMLFSKKVAAGIEAAIPCTRIGILVEGLEVPHAHVHLIPLSESGFRGLKKSSLTKDQFESIAASIRAKLV